MLKDTPSNFSSITKLFHWLMATLIIAQYYYIYWPNFMFPENSKLAISYLRNLHKPFGAVLMMLVLLRILWRLINIKPKFADNLKKWQKNLAHIVHMLLYVCMIVMPLSGSIMSTASGYPTNFFKLFTFPLFMEKNKELANIFANIHTITAYILIVLFILHVSAAVFHHTILKDNTLRKMLPFNRSK